MSIDQKRIDPELVALARRADTLRAQWHEAERAALLAAIQKADGFVKRAAAMLGRPYTSIMRLVGVKGRHADVGAIAEGLRARLESSGVWHGGRPSGTPTR